MRLLIFGIAIGVALLVWRGQNATKISHDDGISYLAATGHQARYTGPLLNVPFHAFTAFAIFLACRLLCCSPHASATAGVLWLMSGSTLSVAGSTRPYSFLALSSACFLVSLLYFLSHPSWRRTVLLFASITAGVLVHYHFPLLLGACLAVASLSNIGKKAWRTLVWLGASLCSASILFFAVHPTFYVSLIRQQDQTQPFSWADVPTRASRCIYTLLENFVPHRYVYFLGPLLARYWLMVLIAVIIALLIAAFLMRGKIMQFRIRRLSGIEYLPTIGLSLSIGALWVLYLSFLSPRHAMGPKYLMLVSPLLFVVVGQLFEGFRNRRPSLAAILTILLLVWQTAYGTLGTVHFIREAKKRGTPPRILETSRTPVILDSVARGVLSTIIWHVHPETPVFASRQNQLGSHFSELVAHDVLFYVSDDRYGNTAEGKRVVLRSFADRGYEIDLLEGGVAGIGELYELKRLLNNTRKNAP